MGILGWTTLLPLLGAVLVMLVPKEEEDLHRGIGLLIALATFAVSLLILGNFETGVAGFQMEVNRPWVPALGISFHLGVDGISLWLVLWKGVDQGLVDGAAVNGSASLARGLGWLGSRLQSGQVGFYVVVFLIGAVWVLRTVTR